MAGSHISAEHVWSSVRAAIGFLATFLTKAFRARLPSSTRRWFQNSKAHSAPVLSPCRDLFLFDTIRSRGLRRVLWTAWFGFGLMCTVNYGVLWTRSHESVLWNLIHTRMSNQLHFLQVDSSQVLETSQDNQIKQDAPFWTAMVWIYI